tara:strand:- start:177 stop:335 length:159 start_codon:yes stop_codon:yes gene_type:complete
MPTDSERLDALEAELAIAIDVQKRLICLVHILSVNGRLPKSAVAELWAEVDC